MFRSGRFALIILPFATVIISVAPWEQLPEPGNGNPNFPTPRRGKLGNATKAIRD